MTSFVDIGSGSFAIAASAAPGVLAMIAMVQGYHDANREFIRTVPVPAILQQEQRPQGAAAYPPLCQA